MRSRFSMTFIGLYKDSGSAPDATARTEEEVVAGVKRRRSAEGTPSSGGAASTPLSSEELSPLPLPRIHVYCFSKAEDPAEYTADVTQRALLALGSILSIAQAPDSAAESPTAAPVLPGLTVRRVRDVAPKKLMLCLSFDLPAAVAYASR